MHRIERLFRFMNLVHQDYAPVKFIMPISLTNALALSRVETVEMLLPTDHISRTQCLSSSSGQRGVFPRKLLRDFLACPSSSSCFLYLLIIDSSTLSSAGDFRFPFALASSIALNFRSVAYEDFFMAKT